MKLREALLGKKRVKVGSGTSFVYCGPVDASRIEKHSGEELARLKAEQAAAELFIEKYPRWKDIFIKNRSASLWRLQALAIKRGHIINSEMIAVRKANGTTAKVACYSIGGER